MDDTRHQIECEVIDFFVRMADLLGLPRSLGELYGALYISPEPLCMNDLISGLNLSKGAVSQGLKTLRGFGAIKTVYRTGERRTYYCAESELRKLASGFLSDRVEPHLESGRERIAHITELVDSFEGRESQFMGERIQRLEKWRRRANQLLPLVVRIVDSGK